MAAEALTPSTGSPEPAENDGGTRGEPGLGNDFPVHRLRAFRLSLNDAPLVETETEAFDEIAASWARWTYWAGLEAIAPLQRGMKRG